MVTHGLELMVAQQAVEHIIDLRCMLHLFGVPMDDPAWAFGDDKFVATSLTIPHHSCLAKRWNTLSCHRVTIIEDAPNAQLLERHHLQGDGQGQLCYIEISIVTLQCVQPPSPVSIVTARRNRIPTYSSRIVEAQDK